MLRWEGAWEYDPVSGTGSVKLGKDGRLRGMIQIENGDDSTFSAERVDKPDEPIPDPPSYRDKWLFPVQVYYYKEKEGCNKRV